jgi:hypothetical protein
MSISLNYFTISRFVRSLLAFTFLSLFILPTFSQNNDRIEIPIRSERDFFNVINLGEYGALMLYGNARSSMDAVFYNTELKQQWSNSLQIDPKSQFIESYQEGGVVYILFGNDSRRIFEIFRISCNIGLIQQYAFNSLPNFEINQFKVNQETAYLGGNIKKEPVILSIELGERTPRVITGGFRERANLQSVEFTQDGNISASYILSRKRRNIIVIKEIAAFGKVVDQKAIEPKKGYTFINGKLFQLGEDKQVVIGNYGTGSTSNGLPVSQGIYIISKLDLRESQQKVDYYSFTEFSSFFDFLSKKRQDKIEKQAKRKKSRGGELRLDYKLLVHDLIKDDDGFLLVADVFKPIIRTNNFNNFGMMPLGMSRFYNPFIMSPLYYSRFAMMNSSAWYPWNGGGNASIEGFDYTHAFMVAFDNDGNIKWDNSIVYDDVKSYDLKEKISVAQTKDSFYAAYTDQSKLSLVVIGENGVTADKETLVVRKENESIKETEFSDASFWYGNNFLYWGYQKIKTTDEGKRKVFFITKVQFDAR